jgi:carboxyl-terminal processing protease
MMKLQCFKALTSILLSSLLVACGGGGGETSSTTVILGSNTNSNSAATMTPPGSGYPGSPNSCDTTTQRAWLRDYMNAKYFWYDRQGTPNEQASSMSSYLDSLLYKPTDRYSFAQGSSSFTQFFVEGKRTGYGYSLVATAADTLVVRYTEPLSPVGLAGLKRSDSIISIDGRSAADIYTNGLPGVSSTGVTRSFVVTNPTDGTRSFTVQSAEYTLSPVLDSRVLTTGTGRKVGYLAFNEFISTAQTPLINSFNSLRTAGVQDLILDLRYNGGGSTSVAQNLALLVGGTRLSGQVFARYQYSAKDAASNFNQNFSTSAYTTPLSGLTRLFVITSGSTASASEMVIHNLKPYMTVATFGSTTFGKPYAFQPIDACNTTYSAVNLQIANALGNGDYAAGISPVCAAPDDLTRQLGDPLESRTAAALGYLSSGACPATSFVPNTQRAGVSINKFAINNIAIEATLGEDGRPLPPPGAAVLDAR